MISNDFNQTSTTSMQRRDDVKKGFSKELILEKRIDKNAELRKQNRMQKLTNKRVKLSKDGEQNAIMQIQSQQNDGVVVDNSLPFQQHEQTLLKLQQELNEKTNQLNNSDAQKRLSSLLWLRKTLCTQTNGLQVFQLIKQLTNFLIHENNDIFQLEATWCLTNIAAGSHEGGNLVIECAPYLILFLESQHISLQEQSLWTLANIAADGIENRDRLKSQGIVLPSVKLLSSQNFAVVRTCLWLLSLLSQGSNPKIGEFISAGIIPLLVSKLSHTEFPDDLLCEALILLTNILSGASPNAIRQFVIGGVIQKLVTIISNVRGNSDLEIIFHTLKCLGILVMSNDAYGTLILTADPIFSSHLAVLVRHFRHSTPFLLQVFSLLSNLAASSEIDVQHLLGFHNNNNNDNNTSGLSVVVGNMIDLLLTLLNDSNSTFALKKEIIFCLTNMMVGQPRSFISNLISKGLLHGFIPFLKSSDLELVHVCLTFFVDILIVSPLDQNSQATIFQLFESQNVSEIFDSLSMHSNPTISDLASKLVGNMFSDHQ